MSLKEKYTADEASLKMDILGDSLDAKCYNENLHARLMRIKPYRNIRLARRNYCTLRTY